MIDFEDWWEHHKDARDSLNFYDAKYVYESQQAKIDELQARIDGALRILAGMRHNGAHRAIDILKGNKDEN